MMKPSLLSKLGTLGAVGRKNTSPALAKPPTKLQPAKLQSAKVGDSFQKEVSKAMQRQPAPAPAPALAESEKKGFFSKLWGGTTHALKEVRRVVFETLGSPIMYGGMKALSAIQEALGVEPKGRSLKPDEIEMLRSIYGDSIDYSKVVIKEGKSGLISAVNPNNLFVVGNTIYVPPGAQDRWNDKEERKGLLVHEMAHVWQYQNGGIGYMGKAVAAQWWGPKGANYSRGYFYQDDVIAGKPFEKLNPEQQASLIEDAFRRGFLPPSSPPGAFFIEGSNGTRVDGAAYVLRAWEMIKAGQGAP